MEEVSIIGCSFFNVKTPILMKLNHNEFILSVEDTNYTFNGKISIFHTDEVNPEWINFGNWTEHHAFVCLYANHQNIESESSVSVIVRKLTISHSILMTVFSLVDLRGDTRFRFDIHESSISYNEDLFGVIWTSLSHLEANIIGSIFHSNQGTLGTNIHSIFTINNGGLFEQGLYWDGKYDLSVTVFNSTFQSNKAYCILQFPFITNYQMFFKVNLSHSLFQDNIDSSPSRFEYLPYRMSAILSVFQWLSFKPVIGGIFIDHSFFINNRNYNYVLYNSPSSGCLPPIDSSDGVVLGISHSHFIGNFLGFSVLKFHPYGPQPHISLVKDTKILLSNSYFISNTGAKVIDDERTEVTYLTSHDYPMFIVENCHFFDNNSTKGSTFHATRINLETDLIENVRGVQFINTTFEQNNALIGGALFASGNLYVAIEKCFVVDNVAEFGGGFFLSQAVITSVGSDDIHPVLKDIDLHIERNRALKSGGGIYQSVVNPKDFSTSEEDYIDRKNVIGTSITFSKNRMGGKNGVINEVTSTPVLLTKNNSEENVCVNLGGEKVWWCYLHQIQLKDIHGKDIVEPSFESMLINVTITSSRKVEQHYTVDTANYDYDKKFYFLLIPKYDTFKEGEKADLKIGFLKYQQFEAKISFKKIMAWGWLFALLGFLFVVSNVICCCYIICLCCTGCCLLRRTRKYGEIVRYEEMMKENFENYDPELLIQSLDDIEREAARGGLDEGGLASHAIVDVRSFSLSSISGEMNEITPLIRGTSIEDLSRPAIEDLSDNNLYYHDSGFYRILKFDDHHLFFGNPNGLATIYYFHENPREGDLYPVFRGMFAKARKEGFGIEYFNPSIFGMERDKMKIRMKDLKKEMELRKKKRKKFESTNNNNDDDEEEEEEDVVINQRLIDEKEKQEYFTIDDEDRELFIKFKGMFLDNLRHGKGTEFVSRSRNVFIVGEYEKGRLLRVIWNNKDVRVIDFVNDIKRGSRQIYPDQRNIDTNGVNYNSSTVIYEAVMMIPKKKRKKGGGNSSDSSSNSNLGMKTRPCVLKLFLEDVSKVRSLRALERETKAFAIEENLKILTFFENENIVDIYGWSGKTSRELGYVMEKCRGNVIQEIRRKKIEMMGSAHELSHKNQIKLMEFKCRVILGVARGMERIHKSGIIHRDLKCSNILISQLGTAKICDFELAVPDSKEWNGIKNLPEDFVGSAFWTSPECLFEKDFDSSVDVYSFGVLIFELLYEFFDDPLLIRRDGRCHVCKAKYIGDRNVFTVKLIDFLKEHHKKHANIEKNEYLFRPNLYGSGKMWKKKKEEEETEGEDDDDGKVKVWEKKEIEEEDEASFYVHDWQVELMRRCWREKSEKRPSFSEIVEVIKTNVGKS